MEIILESGEHLIRFFNIYRAPYSKKHRYTVNHFLEEFEQFLEVVKSKSGTPIIVGDFNIHVQRSDELQSQRFQDLLQDTELIQLVPHIPTHIEGGTLDLIITTQNNELEISPPEIIRLGTNSDHYFVRAEILNLAAPTNKPTSKLIEYRKFEEIDIDSFKADLLLSELWAGDVSSLDLDEAVVLYNNTLTNLIDKHCPVIKRNVKSKHSGANWFDSDLREHRRERRKAERLKRKSPTKENKMKYIQICQSFNKLIWLKKREFYQKSLRSSEQDKRSLYSKIRRLQGCEESDLPRCENEAKLAEDFKTFFDNKCSNIRTCIETERRAKSITASDTKKVFCETQHRLETFPTVEEEDLVKIIKGMPNKFCCLDPIPTWLVKDCITELIPAICHIVNKSLSTGKFPKDLKHAVIRPTIKGNELDKDLLNSYRPVSNLSFLSKVLEKCGLAPMSDYLESNNLLNEAQSGYRAYHSCETLMVRMMNDINCYISENKGVALVLLDLSAAFDTIDHGVLLEKLRQDYGFGDTVRCWIQSYLSHRSFSVKVGNKLSLAQILLFGVPQGSLLGPILFILYTKDLKRIANEFGLIIQLYADDSQLYISFDIINPLDIEGKLETINQCLCAIKRWMLQHFMQLNESKTQFVVLGKPSMNERFRDLSLPITDNMTIMQVDFKGDSAKSLGIKLDSNLTMLRQVNDVKRKCFWTLSNLRQFGHYLDEPLKISLVKTLVISQLDYCNALYAGVSQAVIKKLQSTLNNAVRFIFDIKDWSEDLTPYYRKAHILPVHLRIKYKVCMLVHKALAGTAPHYIRELLCLYQDQHNKKGLRFSSDARLLLRPTIRETTVTKKMFSYHAPIMWNELSAPLRHNIDTIQFKKELKTFYFTNFVHE